MDRILKQILGVVILIAVIVVSTCFYTVDETQQAVITQFGEPIGQPIKEAGLYFKLPVVQKVNSFDKRILSWDGDPNQIPTLDKRYIWVDTTARWKIVDALKFMQTVGNETGAQARLDDIIDAATRDAISGVNLVEAIRGSNRLMLERKDELDSDDDMSVGAVQLEEIKVGREQLMENILQESSKITPRYGIQIVDVRIKRINYVNEVQNKVFERMISERNRAAEKYRSEGQGKKAEIEGQMSKELKEIRSEAYRKAQEIKGQADAEATRIYAEAYGQDTEFYTFMKTLETYKKAIKKDTTLIISTDNEFYEYLKSVDRIPRL